MSVTVTTVQGSVNEARAGIRFEFKDGFVFVYEIDNAVVMAVRQEAVLAVVSTASSLRVTRGTKTMVGADVSEEMPQ